MKICYVGNIDAVHTRRWAKSFARMGHDVHVIYIGGEENNILDMEKAGVKVHLLSADTQTQLNCLWKTTSTNSWREARKRRWPLNLPKTLTVPLKMYWLNPKRLKTIFKKIRPDIVHAWFLCDSGCMAALSGYRPLVVSSWGSDVTLLSDSRTSRPLWMLEWANRLSLRKADVITATSEYLAKETAKYAPAGKVVHVVPFGIDGEVFSPFRRKEKNGIVTIGFAKHLLPKYGPDIILEAFGLLLNKYPLLKLKMAGEGYMLSELQEKTQRMGIRDKVIFLGKIPHEEMSAFLSDVDIAVQPSRRRSESFGVAALEASAMEIPVVSTRVGGVPECVKDGETGILVEPDNPEALAEAILFLIENPRRREQMGKAGREFVLRNYRWQDNVAAMLKLYNFILSGYKSR